MPSTALPLHADVAMVDQAEKPQMPIRHEWVIVSGGWWHQGVCYNVLRHFVFLSIPDIASDTSEFTDWLETLPQDVCARAHTHTHTHTHTRRHAQGGHFGEVQQLLLFV